MPDPLFPHTAKNRFPLPGVIKLDPLRLPPNAEPLDFMLAVMKRSPFGEGSRRRRKRHVTAMSRSMLRSFSWAFDVDRT
jgi:hypothetical protein